jgi:hypothetical protein
MSNASDEGNDDTQITFRCSSELEEQFMLAYRKASIEGHAPADGSRSEALRQLMRAMVNDPSIISKGSTDAEVESGDS